MFYRVVVCGLVINSYLNSPTFSCSKSLVSIMMNILMKDKFLVKEET